MATAETIGRDASDRTDLENIFTSSIPARFYLSTQRRGIHNRQPNEK